MAYIGKEPVVGNFQVCDAISVVNGQAAYTMQVSSTNVVPESANHMLVSLNGILQKPGSSFTVSGSTITFASNLATGDVIDFIMLLGNVLDLGVPSDATVTDAKANFVSTSSGAGLQIKGDGTTDGTLQLNCSQNSHGIKLKSPSHSASQSYTLTFPSTAPSSGSALITDGSGNLSFGSAGGLAKLVSTEISSSTAAIIFDSSVVTAYDNYLIILNGIKTASNQSAGGIMFSTDNGSSFISRSKFTADYKDLAAGSVGGSHTGTFSLNSATIPTMYDNHSTKPLSGYFFFHNCNPLNDGDQNIHCQYHSIYTNQADTEYQQDGAVMYDVTAGQQINYFKIVNSAVNLDEGRATLYGFNT